MLNNLDRLKIFYHVYSQNSVVGAAKILNISQSAVSQALAKLEDEIKSPLFTRLHKKLIPTRVGTELFDIVKRFLTELGGFLKKIEHSREFPVGELRIGAPPEFGKTFLSQAVAGFRKQYPDVSFAIQLGRPDEMELLLRQGTLDFAIIDDFISRTTFPYDSDLFHLEKIIEEKIVLVCSKEYYQSRINGEVNYESLTRQSFVTYRSDFQITNEWFRNHFNRKKTKFNTVLTIDDQQAVISAIRSGVGIGVAATHMIREKIESGDMIVLKENEKEIVNVVSLVQILDKVPSLTEKIFIKFLMEEVLEMTRNRH